MKRIKTDTEPLRKIAAVLAAVTVLFALLAGCSGGKAAEGTGAAASQATDDVTGNGADTEHSDAVEITAGVGETFKFGRFEQNGSSDDGEEDIEWIVLSEEDGMIFAVSKYSLDCKEFNSSAEGTTWDNSTLKAWLNGEFYDGVFNDSEKAKIDDSSAGKVFLLTAEQAKELFAEDADRISEGTEYAYSAGLFRTDNGGVWWWLRTAGSQDGFIAGVDGNGIINADGNVAHRVIHGVRPAIVIKR